MPSEESTQEDAPDSHVVRASYIVYLPFRITETASLPRSNVQNESVSEAARSTDVPIVGAPPVQQYSRSSLSRSSVDATDTAGEASAPDPPNPLDVLSEGSIFAPTRPTPIQRLQNATAELERDDELLQQVQLPERSYE